MIVPDINLLVYVYKDEVPFHDVALGWWESLINGQETIGIPWAVATGFIRVIANPRAMGTPVPPRQSIEVVRQWFSYEHIRPLTPGPQHLYYLGETLSATGSSATMAAANRVPDAHIAALAIEHDAEVHTGDEGFRRYRGLRWRNPLI